MLAASLYTQNMNDTAYENLPLQRDLSRAAVGGVAAGLARKRGDPVWLMQLVFALVLLITAGTGLIVYLTAWVLVPASEMTSQQKSKRKTRETVNVILGIALAVAICLAVLLLA